MITRSWYHTNTVRLGINGFLDLGQRLQGCWELVTHYYLTVNCLLSEIASRKECLLCMDHYESEMARDLLWTSSRLKLY